MRASPRPSRGLAVSMSCQSPRIVARAPKLARRRQFIRRRINDAVVAAAASSDSTPSSSSSSSSSSESSSNFTRASYIPPQKYNANNDGSVALPTRLSGTPMSREARRWFYDDAAESVDALLETGLGKRASVNLTIPETNPEQDTFRIGTLLELVRAIAVKRAKGRGERVRVVVQPPLGEGFFKGMPLSLSGVSSLLSRMDWGEEGETEDEDGGTATSARISTGVLRGGSELDGSGDNSAALGSPACDLLIVVAPQNIVGGSVMPDLLAATAAAEASGASIVIVNPILKDVQSSGGVMSVRGRDVRLAAAASFVPAYHFRPLFVNPTMPFPIRGALRLSWADGKRRKGEEQEEEEGAKWQVYAREDLAVSSTSSAPVVPWSQRETFILAGEQPVDLDADRGGEPTGAEITAMLRERRERVAAAERAVREEEEQEQGGGEKKKGWWW